MLTFVGSTLATGFILWLLCHGSFRILRESRVPLRSRLAWAVLSLMPLVCFMLFHRYHTLFVSEAHYVFRDNANFLPILGIMALNNMVSHGFQRRHRHKAPAAASSVPAGADESAR